MALSIIFTLATYHIFYRSSIAFFAFILSYYFAFASIILGIIQINRKRDSLIYNIIGISGGVLVFLYNICLFHPWEKAMS